MSSSLPWHHCMYVLQGILFKLGEVFSPRGYYSRHPGLTQHHVMYHMSGGMRTWCAHINISPLTIEVKSEVDASWSATLAGLTLHHSTCLPTVLYMLLLWYTQAHAHTQYVYTVVYWNTHALECAYNIHACLLKYAQIHILSILTLAHTCTHIRMHARTRTQHQICTRVLYDLMLVRSHIKGE